MNFEALNKGSNGEMIKENSVPVMNEGNIYAGFWKPYLGSHLGSPAELPLMAGGGGGGRGLGVGGKARFHSNWKRKYIRGKIKSVPGGRGNGKWKLSWDPKINYMRN